MSASAALVRLRFRDGIEHGVAVEHGERILDAALARQVPLLFQCRSGVCLTCTARLTSGVAPMRKGGANVLLKSEADAGFRLLCQTEAAGDCVFALDYDSTMSGGGPVRVKAFVDAVEPIATDAARLKLELADGEWFDFRPGQYVRLRVPGTDVARNYSIASTVADLPAVELLVRLLPGGAMSEWLRASARPDVVVELEAPFGSFFLRDNIRAPHVLIAGGTGLAPMMAMLDTLRQRAGRKPPVVLSFGCATIAGLFHQAELDLRSLWMPYLDVRLSVDREPPGDGIRIGNPVTAIVAEDVSDPATVAYVCGPPGLIEAARRHLLALGLTDDNFHAEQFVATDGEGDQWV